MERDAVHGGGLVLPDGERGVPPGRPRLPLAGHRLLHERRARSGECHSRLAGDPRHGVDDRVRGPAVVAAPRGVGREVPVGRYDGRRSSAGLVGARLPAAGAAAAARGAAAAPRLPRGTPGGAAAGAPVPRRGSGDLARATLRPGPSGGAAPRRRAAGRRVGRGRAARCQEPVAPAGPARRAGLGRARLVRRTHLRPGNGCRRGVDRVGASRRCVDRPLAAARPRAAAGDPGGRIVPRSHAVPARDPAVRADRGRAGALRRSADGARRAVVHPLQRDLRRGRHPRAAERRGHGVPAAAAGAVARAVPARGVPGARDGVGDGGGRRVERVDRRRVHRGRGTAAHDTRPGKPDQRGHGARQLPALGRGHRAHEPDRGGVEPPGVASAEAVGASPRRTRRMSAGTLLLEARHVTQRFRLPNGQMLEALRDVSLSVREHEVVALVGPSGCGKSTLLRLFAGLARPADGGVLYRGQPLEGVLAAAAMVFQSFALLPWLTVGTQSVEEAVFLAGRIVVFGSNPGHVREELENALPYPRQERSPEFEDMVDRLHAILTATLLPEPAPAAPQRLIPFPRVHVSEVTGLLDHLLTRPGGKGPVFELAEDLGVDYDRMSAVVRAAEQLGWVSTPGEVVQLTQTGREVMAMDDAARKDATRARLAKQPLFARLMAMLKESEGAVEDEEVLADLTIYFPFIPVESLFGTIVEWGRYAELLDHDADAERLGLLGLPEGTAETHSEA